MEAEAEKERKMKKARISPNNNDKKRKLEELYDAKLSDWLATARNGSSGAGGSCKRGSSPIYDDGPDKPLLASVGTEKDDDIVLLVPRKQVSTLAVNLKKDNDMNLDRGDKLLTGSEHKGVNLKGYMASDGYHPVTEPYFKEEAVVSTEISTFDEDDKGEWSNEILKNTNELVRREIPDVPNRPDELKPPMCTDNEECYDRLTDTDCSEDDREEAVIVDKPINFTGAPEGGKVVMLEDKMVSLPEDKCLDATDTPEEGATVVQELEKKANLAVDESCGVSKRPEEVTALDTEEREEMGTVAVDNEGTVVSEGVGKAVEGTSHAIEVVTGSKQGIYAGIMYIPPETVALPEVILPVQQANDVGECVAMSCIMEDASVAAGVRGTNDGETSLDFVVEEKREISCIEEIGGENNQISEKDIKQKPEEAPQVDIVECGEDITLVKKNNGGENDNVTQTVEKVVTDNNMAAVVLGFPEEKCADVHKALNLAKKDAEDFHKEVVEVEDAKQVHINTLVNGVASEWHNEVAEVEHIDMTEAKMHAQFDTENPEEAAKVGHADMDDYKRSTGRDTEGEPGDIPEVSHIELEKAREQIENIAHAEMGEVENLMKEDADEKFEEVFDLENTRKGGTHWPMEEDTDGKIDEVSDEVHAETKYMKDFIKEDADNKFQEISELGNIGMDGTHGLMVEDTDGKLNEVSGVVHAEIKDMKDFIKEDADGKVQEVSELESIGMDGTHGPMEEDNDGKLKEVPEVNAEVDEANETEKHSNRPDSILHVDLPARGEVRCFVEEDIKEDNAKVPQVKHANIKDEGPVEKDSKEKPNADGKGLPEKEVEESKEVYQAKQAEGEEHKVLREKDTEECTNDAPGVKHAEEQQDETLSAKYMHDRIGEITVVEQVDGQSETLMKIGTDENSEEISRAQEKEFDNGTVESLKNSVNSEVFSSASIQSKEEQKEVFVEDMIKKQHFQDVDLINESESLSDGTAVEIQGADDHKTLDMHDDVAVKQIHDCGIICENTETQILEDNHIVHSEVNDLVVMEVDEAWSTVRTHNQEAFDLEKETMEARHDIGSTIKNIKMAVLGDAIMPGCCEFQTDSPETKITEVVSTKGIMSQEHLSINEKQLLEKGLECKLTEGNARPLVATNVLGGDGVDTTVVTVDVNRANCIEGIQNQDVCITEEARQGKQHTGVGDARILEDTSTNDSGDAGSEKDLCMEKITQILTLPPRLSLSPLVGSDESCAQDLVVLEKQDEAMADDNTERTLVDRGAPECGEAKHDGTMEMIHETDSAVQAVNMTEDKIPFKNEQKLAVLEKQDEGTTDKNTERTLVDTDAPECGEAKHDGTMEMIHETDSIVQAEAKHDGTIEMIHETDSALLLS
uniref:Uncharacterized protein n=1 Tax=Avena sativa TaxID=4498 RepID=A0ACD5UX67_AVESA